MKHHKFVINFPINDDPPKTNYCKQQYTPEENSMFDLEVMGKYQSCAYLISDRKALDQ